MGASSASTGVEGHGDMGRRFATINGKRQRSGKGQALDRRPGMSRARTGAGAGCKTKKYLRSRQGSIPSVIIDWYGNYPLWADIRSEERRVGKEGVSKCRSRRWPEP